MRRRGAGSRARPWRRPATSLAGQLHVAQLVGVADDVEGDDPPAVDREREHIEILPFAVDEAELAVDRARRAAHLISGALALAFEREQGAGDALGAFEWEARRGYLAAAVGAEHHIGVEHLQQSLEVAHPARFDEGDDDPLVLLGAGREARLLRLDVAARPRGELAHR